MSNVISEVMTYPLVAFSKQKTKAVISSQFAEGNRTDNHPSSADNFYLDFTI